MTRNSLQSGKISHTLHLRSLTHACPGCTGAKRFLDAAARLMAWVVPVAGILWCPGDRGSVQPKDNGGDVVLGTALESGCDNGFGDLLRVVSIVEYPGQCQVVDSIGDPI